MRWYFRTSRSKLSCRRAGRGRRVLRRLRVRSLGLPRRGRRGCARFGLRQQQAQAAPGIGPQGPPPDGKGVVAASKGHTPGGQGLQGERKPRRPLLQRSRPASRQPDGSRNCQRPPSGRLAARIPGTGRHAASVTAPPRAPAPRARRRRPVGPARPPTAARMPPPRRRPGRRARTRHEAASPRQARPGARARELPSQTRRTAIEPLVPPKPKEFDRPTSIFICRASLAQ